MRDISDILKFRKDISPFLVHLTRASATGHGDARAVLTRICQTSRLRAGPFLGDARFGINTIQMAPADQRDFFGAVCFTETPLDQVHCLLEIASRAVDLEPYGLVFLRERLENRGVSPVIYINNCANDKNHVIRTLCSTIQRAPAVAKQLLPLVAVFGIRFTGPGAPLQTAAVDFRWEREWRYPHSNGPFEFSEEDIFIGLCPHTHIAHFEGLFFDLPFIDPRRPREWYAKKLLKARHRSSIDSSVL